MTKKNTVMIAEKSPPAVAAGASGRNGGVSDLRRRWFGGGSIAESDLSSGGSMSGSVKIIWRTHPFLFSLLLV